MKKLRAQLGLSQLDMSRLIGSNKTTGSLYEKGSRALNAKALRQLSTLHLLMERTTAIRLQDAIHIEDLKALRFILVKLERNEKLAALKRDALRIKLSNMEDTYACNRNLWRLLQAMKMASKGQDATPYVEILEIKCLDKLKSCSLHQQLLIRNRINILEGEMASATQIIEEYEGYGMPVGLEMDI